MQPPSTPITYRSYAKINLYLDVLNRRRDGYHNIETIFQTVSLCDELTFQEQPSRIDLTCSTPELDTGEGNLVCRAAMVLQEQTGYVGGAKIHLEKNIPLAAGLAGGSGNAAATLIALNTLWNLRLPLEPLRGMAIDLGSDVPYCTLGGPAAATRRGEELTPLRCGRSPACPQRSAGEDTRTTEGLPPSHWAVLAHPHVAISASRTYNHPRLGHNTETPFAGRTPSFRRALRRFRAGDLAGLVYNRMEEPVFHDLPHLAELKARMLDAGCIAAAMSGSGPTLFGVCSSQAAALRVADQITDYPTSVVSFVPVGVERVR